MIESSISVCPVPSEQQPLNEYEELKSSDFFSTCSLNRHDYIKKLIWIWSLSWLVAAPVASASFAPYKYTAQFVVCGAVGAIIGVALVLVRWYLGWSYIGDRLTSQTIFYEESGWYDGQTWTKPLEIVTRDRLIVTYQIRPILQRLERTLLFLGLWLIASAVVWNFL